MKPINPPVSLQAEAESLGSFTHSEAPALSFEQMMASSGEEFEAESDPESDIDPSLDPTWVPAGGEVAGLTPVEVVEQKFVDELSAQIVEQGQVLTDEKGQKIVLMTLVVPGKGQVRVRLWKKQQAIEIRLRPTDPSTKAELRSRQPELESRLREKGVNLGKVDIA